MPLNGIVQALELPHLLKFYLWGLFLLFFSKVLALHMMI